MQNSQLNIIRKIDAEKLAEIHAECFDKPWNSEDILSYLNRDTCFGIWFEPISFVIFEVVDGECEIKTIAVLPESRRQSFAEIMCSEMAFIAKELGAKKIFLEVSEKNISAQALYAKLGYKEISRRKDYYSKGEDAQILALYL